MNGIIHKTKLIQMILKLLEAGGHTAAEQCEGCVDWYEADHWV